MQAETWFTAQEALEYGFIDSITEKSTAKNTWNLSAFANPPKPLPDPEPEPVKNETEPAPEAGFYVRGKRQPAADCTDCLALLAQQTARTGCPDLTRHRAGF